MENIITEVVSEIKEVKQLSDPQFALQHLPPNTVCASIATVMLLDDVNRLKLHFSRGSSFGPLTTTTNTGMDGTKYIGYIYHDGASISFATAEKVLYNFPVATITGADASYDKFFLLLLPENKALAVGQLSYIQFLPEKQIRSPFIISGNGDSWYEELIQLNVVSDAQRKKNALFGNLFFAVWAVGFIVLLIVILSH